MSTSLLAIITGMPGWVELLVVAFVGLLIFGKRLPDVARSVGKSVVEFKRGLHDVGGEIDRQARSGDRSVGDSGQPGGHALPPPDPAAENKSSADQPIKSTDN